MRNVRRRCAATAACLLLAGGFLASPGSANADPRRALAAARPVEKSASVAAAVVTAGPVVQSRAFESAALHRAMPYLVYLPPGYGASERRYPVLYMLHGMSGTNEEWRTYGIFDVADRMIRGGEIAPLLIVLPQGDQAYWVDHAGGGEAWGRYAARDVVAEIDSHFRTLADRADRAIGGVSMGAHGAVQLALNYPKTFAAVGAHSLVLRRFGSAPAYFGDAAEYAKRDPMGLVYAKADAARSFALWIDIGDRDPWTGLASQFERELRSLRIDHQWHEWPGDHSGTYWSAHLRDYLRFYDAALATGSPRSLPSATPLD